MRAAELVAEADNGSAWWPVSLAAAPSSTPDPTPSTNVGSTQFLPADAAMDRMSEGSDPPPPYAPTLFGEALVTRTVSSNEVAAEGSVPDLGIESMLSGWSSGLFGGGEPGR